MSFLLPEFILTLLLCKTIFVTANGGLYVSIKFRNVQNVAWRTSFIYGLGTYWLLNYIRLIYLIPSFFTGNINGLFRYYLVYTQISYCTQNLILLALSIGRLILSCQTQLFPTTMIWSTCLYFFFVVISTIYAVLLFIVGLVNIQGYVGIAIIVFNIASFILSLITVIVSSYCVKNPEKRQQMNYAWITLFISLCFIIQYAVAITIGITG